MVKSPASSFSKIGLDGKRFFSIYVSCVASLYVSINTQEAICPFFIHFNQQPLFPPLKWFWMVLWLPGQKQSLHNIQTDGVKMWILRTGLCVSKIINSIFIVLALGSVSWVH